MKIISIPIEATEEERRQAAQGLAWVLAQIIKERRERMEKDYRWTIKHFYCRRCFEDGGKLQPLVGVWSEKLQRHVVGCGADRSHTGTIRKETAEYLLNTKGGDL